MQKTLLGTLVLFLFLTTASAQKNYTSGGILSENQANMDIKYYGLNLTVNPNEKYLSGYVDIKLLLKNNSDKIELDLVDFYKVSKIEYSGNPSFKVGKISFIQEGDKLYVNSSKFPTQTDFILKIYYSGNPPIATKAPWVGGFTWANDSTGNHWVGVTCPNEGAKVFYPCKDHPSDRPDSVRLNITVPKGYYCAANGVLEEEVEKEKWTTYNWITRYPISNYNVNITIGDLVPVTRDYTSIEGNTFPVTFYVLREKLHKAEKHLDLAVDNLSTLEKFYGEYPFVKEKFGLAHTPYLGMEHQTINAYGNKFKYTTIRGSEFDWLMLHEMGHEWWANKVSCEDWSDYWIHEGICSYGDALYILDHFGKEEYLKKIENTRRGIKNESPIVPKKNASTDEVYQGDIYSKGAFMMHSLRFIMGNDKFYAALKGFAAKEENTYENLATADEFIDYFSEINGASLRPFIEMNLYTNDLIEIKSEKTDVGFQISIPSIDYTLPVEIKVGNEIQKITVGKKPVQVVTEEFPEVDPNGWYLTEKN